MPSSGPLRYSYFNGFVAAGTDAANSEQYVVAHDDKLNKFYMALKSSVLPTRLTRVIFFRAPQRALELCPEHCGCSKGKGCSKVHLKQEPIELRTSAIDEKADMLVCLKSGTNTRVSPSHMQVTAGLLYFAALKGQGLITEGYPWVCHKHVEGRCPNGPKCLMLHVDPELVKDARRAPVEASTPIATAMQQSIPRTPGLQQFIDTTLFRMGLRTQGDLAVLGNHVFEALSQRDILANPQNRTFWLLVIQQRAISRSTPLTEALLQFPGIDMKTLSYVEEIPYLPTVNDLLTLRPKVLYGLPMRAQLLDACERLRARFEDDREVYSQISLSDLPEHAFFRRMSQLVCDFRHKHAHKSWRKQDATRPIVTSLIAYVDPDECECSLDSKASMASQSAAVSELAPSSSAAALSPEASSKLAIRDVPSADHWCQCRRRHLMAVNYELSTPSGSRCSEQNALGMMASMGLPTTCVREVFVHGGVHNTVDPNPLFPCGVCENMFRRVSKDVQKQHGGDVMLYMFDQETNPRKLVCLPVSEISHREGSSFRRFVAEDVREDAASTGMYTPVLTYTGTEDALTIPPMPMGSASDGASEPTSPQVSP